MRGLPLWLFAYAMAAFAAAITWQLATSATQVVTRTATSIERLS